MHHIFKMHNMSFFNRTVLMLQVQSKDNPDHSK